MSSVLNSTFPRSASSPNISDLVEFAFNPSATQQKDELVRSASFTSLPISDNGYILEKEGSIALERPAEPIRSQTLDGREEQISNRLTKEERPKLERIGRRKSLVARPKSWIQKVRGSPERQNSSESVVTTPSDAPPVPAISKHIRDGKTKTVTESFATFARKSWMSPSRSPSPKRNLTRKPDSDGKDVVASKIPARPGSPSRRPKTPTKAEQLLGIGAFEPKPRPLSTFQKMKQRPASVFMNLAAVPNSANSSTSSLPRSSMDNKSTPRTSTDKVPPLPKNLSTDKLSIAGIEISARRRDELWSAFRSIDYDYAKFQNKSWSLKTNVVRSSLLPFLRNHATHPSNKTLRPEDLDRRVAILNKWWMGLLEVLDGRQNQTVSGVDRPILLEACYAIMTRPEWRLAPSHYAPLADRPSNRSPERRPFMRKNSSSASLVSSASQFMTESVYHNTRNLFVQNLLSQMTFVVDKMSLRHAPASLVTFCGKAAAYAFFFVPGVAEMMVRIWELQTDVLRRISDGLGMPRRVNKMELDDVISEFPEHVRSLGWTSVKSMAAQLRQTPSLPIMASKIPWHGPWIARWCGRDSDLFYVFVKHYHVLVEEFLPLDLSLAEKARAPGFLLVQAQVLSLLDATIHRQPIANPLPLTFDDVLAGADATAALPLPSNNSTRLMAENRLIMLLRDFISERPSDYAVARRTFAESFGKIVQASAGRTSTFDHNACFVLCDFVEEALAIYARFYYAHDLESDFIDWPFWLTVCQKMLSSENSMSEIRTFALLYGSWHLLTADEHRKETMCLNWLVTDETFDTFFNHWCPMVRAYYMRLLCWRLCRDSGESTDLDTKIYSAVSLRLKANWAHYLFLKQNAERARILPPSTAPCHPAPGRRLLIIRNDNQLPAASMFLGFDGIPNSSSQSTTTKPTVSKRLSSIISPPKAAPSEISDTDDSPTPKLTPDAPTTTPTKKRWTFMNKVLASTTPPTPSSAPPEPTSPTKSLAEARHATALSRSRPAMHSATSSTDSETPPSTSTHRSFSFKFSLEWAQHFDKPSPPSSTNGNGNGNANMNMGKNRSPVRGGANVGPERRLSPPRLPAPAQAWIGAHVLGMSAEIGARDPGAASLASGNRPQESEGEKERQIREDRKMRAKYAGRALAEWAVIVAECNNFVERRRAEGVPSLKFVEVPTLGVEGFRRFA